MLKGRLYIYLHVNVDVSQNRGGPPKWMVYNGNPPIKMDDWGHVLEGSSQDL